MKNTIVFGALSLALVACGGGDDTQTTSTTTPDTTTPAASTPVMAPMAGTVLANFPADADMLTGREWVTVSRADKGVSLSGTSATASAGAETGGASIEVSEDVAAAVSGKPVTITVRAAGDAGSTMRVAYSTNRVGNSGWQEFELSEDMQDYSFTYPVPADDQTATDYIGILPGAYGDVVVAGISYEIGE
ncbi:hypothetical protein FF098_016610 [Parvularcula flava]|uniref:Lipoprotein n=1 Tax=Aquisalinus luteolus TaxID=1566827 RepID=A0A8J3A5Z7_9PROT|nr:hypothetical protein [Aquisalinus luteolus]NHK29532.1 hypothetical protein [Aquisalinus luteolus]GGI01655.1 hypothetical protein GCM10011355_32820 [Aquisalinus luteolus]